MQVVSEFQPQTSLSQMLRPAESPTIVVFGQSWCHDCKRELPRLKSFHEKFFPHVRVVVLTDEGLRTMVQWKAAMKLPFQYFNTLASFESVGVNAYPTTYILDKNLNSVYSKVGDVPWDNLEVRAALAPAK